MGSDSRIVVIGAGMAGARLARGLAPVCEVTLLGEEPYAPYNRVLLAEVLAGRYGPEVIALPPLPAGRGAVRRGVRAVRIDRAARTVHCADGTAVGYDRLVLATGSNPVLPPLRGVKVAGGRLPDGVHPFRTLDDCLALAATARAGTRAVVIGGGLLGVSAARALAERGADVVLVHQGAALMDRHLDPAAGALVRRHLEDLGVEVHTECRARGLRHDGTTGAVSGVELADGFVLDADCVVLACGVRPRTGLATAAGLEVHQGIVVDDELRTSDPRIHAIGDCAEHAGTVYGVATAALEQADALTAILTAHSTTHSMAGLPREPLPEAAAGHRTTAEPTTTDYAAPGRPSGHRTTGGARSPSAGRPTTASGTGGSPGRPSEPRTATDGTRSAPVPPRTPPGAAPARPVRRPTAATPTAPSVPDHSEVPLPARKSGPPAGTGTGEAAPLPAPGQPTVPPLASGTQAEPEPGTPPGADTETGTEPATGTAAGTPPGAEPGTAAETAAGAGEAAPVAGTQPRTPPEADAEAGTEPATQPKAKPETEPETEPGTAAETAAGAGEAAPVAGAEPAAGVGVGVGGPAGPRYTGTRALTRLTLSGSGSFDIAAFGEPTPLPGDDVVQLADATRGAYRKVVVRGDRLVGGVLLGDLDAVGTLARAWEGDEPVPAAPLLHLLTTNGGS
ncbi:FAD-dependent oxidoreductase [Streptomyces sp. FIT100]|nr:FAD-dependent oxidoreductase [Streptomyces sp. FIT100]